MTTTAEAEYLAIEAAILDRARSGRPDFHIWSQVYRPEYDWTAPHFGLLARKLDRITRRDMLRLIVQISVRHGKTETLIGYMAHRLHLDPKTRILLGTYNSTQAYKLSRQVRKLAGSLGVEVSKDRDAAGEWETEAGGGLRAVGAGSGVASVNADLIVIDDPIGSREEAESAAHRDRVWDWVTTDILARCEPQTGVVFSMPRWHHDDPSGRLQQRQADRWEIIDLPGVAEENDQLGRKPGELLWPALRPQSWVDNMRIDLGSWGFASAVQCRPSPREGGMFRWGWLQEHMVDARPADVVHRVRYWDTAGTEGDGDYTAGVLMSRTRSGLFYIEDVVRGQWAPGRRDMQIVATCRQDAQLGGRYEVGLETDAGVGGQDRTRAIVSQLAGLSVYSERPTGSKTLRADPVASQAQVGNIRVLRGHWNRDFLDELLQFPGSKHDDQVDAMSGAFARLTSDPGEPETDRFSIF
jgi:predicted phage terminase large subunit-like protein